MKSRFKIISQSQLIFVTMRNNTDLNEEFIPYLSRLISARKFNSVLELIAYNSTPLSAGVLAAFHPPFFS